MSTLTTPLLTAEQLRRIRDNFQLLSNRPDGNVDIGSILNAAIAAIAVDLTAIEAGGVVQVAEGTIAAAAVATLNATPVEVIAAPGAGFYVDVLQVDWFLDFESAAYDAPASGDTLGLKYTNGSGVQLVDVLAGNGIGAATADYHATSRGLTEWVHTAGDNAPVVAHLDGGEWFASAGDSPLKYRILYVVRETLT
jgi:hypothetical protein